MGIENIGRGSCGRPRLRVCEQPLQIPVGQSVGSEPANGDQDDPGWDQKPVNAALGGWTGRINRPLLHAYSLVHAEAPIDLGGSCNSAATDDMFRQ